MLAEMRGFGSEHHRQMPQSWNVWCSAKRETTKWRAQHAPKHCSLSIGLPSPELG